MRKLNLAILTLCLFFWGQLHAASIDIEKARQKAAQFITKQSAYADSRRMLPSRTPQMELAYQHTTELLANCTIRWTTVKDVNGAQFTGPNGNKRNLDPRGQGSSCPPVEMAGVPRTVTTAAAAYIGQVRCVLIIDTMLMGSILKTGMPIGDSPGVTTATLSVP